VAVIEVICVHCSSNNVVKNGKSLTGEQRYKCRAFHCEKTFQLVHRYNACEKGVYYLMSCMKNGSVIPKK
jgi:transposase-like protein